MCEQKGRRVNKDGAVCERGERRSRGGEEQARSARNKLSEECAGARKPAQSRSFRATRELETPSVKRAERLVVVKHEDQNHAVLLRAPILIFVLLHAFGSCNRTDPILFAGGVTHHIQFHSIARQRLQLLSELRLHPHHAGESREGRGLCSESTFCADHTSRKARAWSANGSR